MRNGFTLVASNSPLLKKFREIYLSLTPVKTVQVKISFLSVMPSWWYSVRIPPFDVHASTYFIHRKK